MRESRTTLMFIFIYLILSLRIHHRAKVSIIYHNKKSVSDENNRNLCRVILKTIEIDNSDQAKLTHAPNYPWKINLEKLYCFEILYILTTQLMFQDLTVHLEAFTGISSHVTAISSVFWQEDSGKSSICSAQRDWGLTIERKFVLSTNHVTRNNFSKTQMLFNNFSMFIIFNTKQGPLQFIHHIVPINF